MIGRIFLLGFLFLMLVLLVFFVVVWYNSFFVSIFLEAPFVPMSKKNLEKMLKVANFKSGEKVYELGSGDGRFLVEAAKRYGIIGTGFEWIRWLVLLSNFKAKKSGVSDKVKFKKCDFWRENLSDADWVVVYLMPKSLDKLKSKLKAELKKGAKVLSLSFEISGLNPKFVSGKDKTGSKVLVYEF